MEYTLVGGINICSLRGRSVYFPKEGAGAHLKGRMSVHTQEDGVSVHFHGGMGVNYQEEVLSIIPKKGVHKGRV